MSPYTALERELIRAVDKAEGQRIINGEALRERLAAASIDEGLRFLLLARLERLDYGPGCESPEEAAEEPEARPETLRERVERLGAELASAHALRWSSYEVEQKCFAWMDARRRLAEEEEVARRAVEQAAAEAAARLSLEQDAARWRALVASVRQVGPTEDGMLRAYFSDKLKNSSMDRTILTRFVDKLRAASETPPPSPTICPRDQKPCVTEECETYSECRKPYRPSPTPARPKCNCEACTRHD